MGATSPKSKEGSRWLGGHHTDNYRLDLPVYYHTQGGPSPVQMAGGMLVCKKEGVHTIRLLGNHPVTLSPRDK